MFAVNRFVGDDGGEKGGKGGQKSSDLLKRLADKARERASATASANASQQAQPVPANFEKRDKTVSLVLSEDKKSKDVKKRVSDAGAIHPVKDAAANVIIQSPAPTPRGSSKVDNKTSATSDTIMSDSTAEIDGVGRKHKRKGGSDAADDRRAPTVTEGPATKRRKEETRKEETTVAVTEVGKVAKTTADTIVPVKIGSHSASNAQGTVAAARAEPAKDVTPIEEDGRESTGKKSSKGKKRKRDDTATDAPAAPPAQKTFDEPPVDPISEDAAQKEVDMDAQTRDYGNVDVSEKSDRQKKPGRGVASQRDGKEEKIRVVPKWVENAVEIDSAQAEKVAIDTLGLSEGTVSALRKQGITHFFSVQSAVLPVILAGTKSPIHPGDICVCAPTGSGKTLAFAVPIVEALRDRVVPRLRALILQPTRDLALQVKVVLDAVTVGTNLRVVVSTGQTPFVREQEEFNCQTSKRAGSVGEGEGKGKDKGVEAEGPQIDILVCTPGRLVDHITSTPGFTLKHLRFLVVDEADRLLHQSYQQWLPKVLRSAQGTSTPDDRHGDDAWAVGMARQSGGMSAVTPSAMCREGVPLQKLLFSATLTNNPEKIASLNLYSPRFFSIRKRAGDGVAHKTGADANVSTQAPFVRFATPATLKEYSVVCSAGEKPLVLLHLLRDLKFDRVICFTASVESTHRLFLLLKLFGGIDVAEYSSSLPQRNRTQMLEDFRRGSIKVLVCSDAMTRGMDLDNVQHVISYDAPVYVKTYIHRVGRTARAGQSGNAYTFLRPEEMFHFKEMLLKLDKQGINKFPIAKDALKKHVDLYQATLGELKKAIDYEKFGRSMTTSASGAAAVGAAPRKNADGGEDAEAGEAITSMLQRQMLSNFSRMAHMS